LQQAPLFFVQSFYCSFFFEIDFLSSLSALTFAAVRLLDGLITDAAEAKSLSLNPQHIDIYSNRYASFAHSITRNFYSSLVVA
jgi:hypothetical protein